MSLEPKTLDEQSWRARYMRTANNLKQCVVDAPIALCLSNACVDAVCRLMDLDKAVTSSSPSGARDLFDKLQRRAIAGRGGELRCTWKGGPEWLRERLSLNRSIGGTGPQAAAALAAIGVPNLVALGNRNEVLLSTLPANVNIAVGNKLFEGRHVEPTTSQMPEIFIFEFSAGETIAGTALPRSSRVIVRFDDPGLERDPEFDTYSNKIAGNAAALIGGLGSVPSHRIDAELSYLKGLVETWRTNGLRWLHLELGGYEDKATLDAVLKAVGGIATSLGMSASEFPDVAYGRTATPEHMVEVAQQLGVERLCVHADDWASSVTRRSAETETEALITGSLLSAVRAAHGTVVSEVKVPEKSRFTETPYTSSRLEGEWNYISVATPYLIQPVATIGLGDTFSAGCILVLGQEKV
ncbi:ADP-dependent glucokinase/phosphofructokinase [Lentilitoribacter sp. EG35]|uniref:ADP-dependent glucokinase/phosphofructokinase n=1 Tax=Lentilitoribacter sp. EG35 TaxID=3234192 RepID=UPI003460E53F